ncbi:MAG TPA: Stp1/IreP family PP2C-type Ser/Thr phosphatase [Acidimicrobiales bacterium]|nr:Stp1/IreP family PP2C-type Ser/Thr phosphatase [Acidimicrobiales bacterium]
MTRLRWGSATDVGRVRQNNEDNLLIASPLFAVADGMGGHAAGEVASGIAVEALGSGFDANRTASGLADAVRAANRAVWERAQQQSDLRGMGTTLTAVALVDDDGQDVLAVVNVGDSRAYRLQGGDLEQLTEDHSLVEELVRTGRISAAEAQVHPQKHVLTRVLGVDADVEVDCFRVIPYEGDRFLLASDGLFNEVDDRTIASVLRSTADPDEAAAKLVELAKANGGNDNITVVVVDVVDDDNRAEKASAALADDAPPPLDWRDLEEDDDHRPRQKAKAQKAQQPKRRRMTGRVVAFLLILLLLLGGAAGAVAWFARGSYYVGLDGDRVTIYQGRPDGLLWFDPTVARRTDLTTADVVPGRLDALEKGKQEPSLADAEEYVENLRDEAEARFGTPSSAPPTSTSSPTTSP